MPWSRVCDRHCRWVTLGHRNVKCRALLYQLTLYSTVITSHCTDQVVFIDTDTLYTDARFLLHHRLYVFYSACVHADFQFFTLYLGNYWLHVDVCNAACVIWQQGAGTAWHWETPPNNTAEYILKITMERNKHFYNTVITTSCIDRSYCRTI